MEGRSPESEWKVEKKALRRIWDTDTTDVGTLRLEREARAGGQDMEGAQSGDVEAVACEPCFPVWLPVGGVLALAPLLEMWGGC